MGGDVPLIALINFELDGVDGERLCRPIEAGPSAHCCAGKSSQGLPVRCMLRLSPTPTVGAVGIMKISLRTVMSTW